MGGKKQEKPQARRDSDGVVRGGVRGDQGSAESATDKTSGGATTQGVHQSAWSTVPGNAAMIPPPPTDVASIAKQFSLSSELLGKREIELRQVTITVPAIVGLNNGYATETLHARLNRREAIALRCLIEGYDSNGFESPGSRSANGQDWIRFVLNAVADELGL